MPAWNTVDALKKWWERIEFLGKVIALVSVVVMPVAGDFLRPLGSVNLTVFIASSAIALVLFVCWTKDVKVFGLGFGKLLMVCLLLAAGSGAWWWLAEYRGGGEQGFLASRSPAVQKLQSSVVTPVDGGKLAAEVRKQAETEKEAETSLGAILKGYPANCIKAEVVVQPRVKKRTDAGVVLEYDLRLSVDQAKYDAVVTRLIPALERVASRSGETFAAAQPSEREMTGIGKSDFVEAVFGHGFELYEKVTLPKFMDIQRKDRTSGFERDWWRQKLDKDTEMVVVVNTARSGAEDRTTWRWFHVPKTDAFRQAVRVDVRFLGKDSTEMTRDSFAFRKDSSLGILGMKVSKYPVARENWGVTEVIVSPFQLNDVNYIPWMTITREITLTQAELSRLGEVVCSASSP